MGKLQLQNNDMKYLLVRENHIDLTIIYNNKIAGTATDDIGITYSYSVHFKVIFH